MHRKKIEKTNKLNSVLIWGIANLFYLYEVVLRVSPSVMTDKLMMHYCITTSILGVLISFFYYSYTALQIPCGLILDKFGPRNIICASIIFSAVGSLLFASTGNLYIAQFGRCLVGTGGACAFISCLQIASSLFPRKYFAIFAGISNMMGTLGALCGGFPIAKCVNLIGWQETIIFLAIIGIIIAIIAFLFIPKEIRSHHNLQHHRSFKDIFIKVVKNKQIVLIGLVGGFMYLPISVFSELWAVPFFMSKYNINNETASFASSMLFVGFAIGSIPVAVVAKRINSYMKTIRFSIIFVTFLFIPLIYINNMFISFTIVFVIGVLTAAEVLVFTCAKNNESEQNSGTAIAFANALVMLAGSIFQPVLGMMLDFFWTNNLSIDGIRIYDVYTYQKAMLTLPLCLIIAFILSLFVNETIYNEKAF